MTLRTAALHPLRATLRPCRAGQSRDQSRGSPAMKTATAGLAVVAGKGLTVESRSVPRCPLLIARARARAQEAPGTLMGSVAVHRGTVRYRPLAAGAEWPVGSGGCCHGIANPRR